MHGCVYVCKYVLVLLAPVCLHSEADLGIDDTIPSESDDSSDEEASADGF